VSAEKFLVEGQKNHQDQEIASISLHFISGGLEGALGMYPGLTSRECCARIVRSKDHI